MFVRAWLQHHRRWLPGQILPQVSPQVRSLNSPVAPVALSGAGPCDGALERNWNCWAGQNPKAVLIRTECCFLCYISRDGSQLLLCFFISYSFYIVPVFYSISLTKQKHSELLVCTWVNETKFSLCISIPFPAWVPMFLLNEKFFCMKNTHRNIYVLIWIQYLLQNNNKQRHFSLMKHIFVSSEG